MKTDPRFIYFTLFTFFCLQGCASPELRRWEGKSFTLCCKKDQCKAEKWQEKIVAHCPGAARLVGGSNEEKVSGFTLSGTGSDKYNQAQTVQAQTVTEECRKYECTHKVIH